jgi:hypothetical protein
MSDERTVVDLLAQVVAPVGGAYVLVLAALYGYRRSRRRLQAGPADETRTESRSSPGWRDLVRYVVATAAGGYVLFLAIVVVFYPVLGRQDRTFILEALREGSLLAFAIVVPGFLLISWLYERPWARPRPSREEAGL